MGIETEIVMNVVTNCITIAIALLICTAVLYVVRSMLDFVSNAFNIQNHKFLKGLFTKNSKFKESGLND